MAIVAGIGPKKRNFTAEDAEVRKCSGKGCDPEKNKAAAFQEKRYGKGLRVKNPNKNGFVCTACQTQENV